LEAIRSRVFQASKTDARDYEGFKRDLGRSLQVLRTDHIDLHQLHDMQPDKSASLSAKLLRYTLSLDGVNTAIVRLDGFGALYENAVVARLAFSQQLA
jgi:aryl-alcohol dehydrogenase-like predicted oxidoreductase